MLLKAFIKEKTVKPFQVNEMYGGEEVNQSIYYSSSKGSNLNNPSDSYGNIEKQIENFLDTDKTLTKSSSHSLDKQLELRKGELDEGVLSAKSPFYTLLHAIPSNYPASRVFLNGSIIEVSSFLAIDKDKCVVHFSRNETVLSFPINEIDGIQWG